MTCDIRVTAETRLHGLCIDSAPSNPSTAAMNCYLSSYRHAMAPPSLPTPTAALSSLPYVDNPFPSPTPATSDPTPISPPKVIGPDILERKLIIAYIRGRCVSLKRCAATRAKETAHASRHAMILDDEGAERIARSVSYWRCSITDLGVHPRLGLVDGRDVGADLGAECGVIDLVVEFSGDEFLVLDVFTREATERIWAYEVTDLGSTPAVAWSWLVCGLCVLLEKRPGLTVGGLDKGVESLAVSILRPKELALVGGTFRGHG